MNRKLFASEAFATLTNLRALAHAVDESLPPILEGIDGFHPNAVDTLRRLLLQAVASIDESRAVEIRASNLEEPSTVESFLPGTLE